MSRDARPRRSPGGCPADALVGWEVDRGARKVAAHRGEVSRGHSTGGDRGCREGPNAMSRNQAPVLARVAVTAANPERGLDEVARVKPEHSHQEQSDLPAPGDSDPHPAPAGTWEEVFSRDNLARALRRVERNAGAPGIDGIRTDELRSWLHRHWPEVIVQLDAGTYRPQPVRRVEISKPSGGTRKLGVPTALDRMIGQAITQVLSPVFDPDFSDHSFGFRPKRSAHQAVGRARQFIQDGAAWVVDVDLDSFFDRVGHDMVMARVARRVHDRRLLRLVRRYLEAGVMLDGVRVASDEGTPQGSPLSPLLSNVMLDDLDRELERRGHRFVRYADDAMVFVASERAGKRVMESITHYIEVTLRLRVNREKSAVGRATRRTFLGFGFFRRRDGEVAIRIDPKALARARARIRKLTARSGGTSMAHRIAAINRFTQGWAAYFHLADTPSVLNALDGWLRRRLRQVRWKEWKHAPTGRRALVALGVPFAQARAAAGSHWGPWRTAASPVLHRALSSSYWSELGLMGFLTPHARLRDTS